MGPGNAFELFFARTEMYPAQRIYLTQNPSQSVGNWVMTFRAFEIDLMERLKQHTWVTAEAKIYIQLQNRGELWPPGTAGTQLAVGPVLQNLKRHCGALDRAWIRGH
jgi:hypothetical protein